MARHRYTGKRKRLPRDMRGRAAHRAISYAREMFVARLALWVSLRLTTPRLGG